jgi:ABC-type uncharacterized transport system substrate-binding protein
MLRKVCVSLRLATWIIVIGSQAASAHPHAWIDVRTTLILSGASTVSAIREEWTFDRDYTKYVLHDSQGQETPLPQFTRSAMQRLASYGYFMELRAGGTRLSLGQATGAASRISNGSLLMHFTVALARPINLSTSPIIFSVYDPTYYIAFAHVKDHSISFEGTDVAACSARIKSATPSAQALSQAQAMDRNAPINTSLGKMFAETVSVHC